MLYQFYDDWQIRPMATLRAMRLVTREWAQPGDGDQRIYPATSDVLDAKGPRS